MIAEERRRSELDSAVAGSYAGDFNEAYQDSGCSVYNI